MFCLFFFCFFRLFSLTGDNSNDDDRPLAADFVLFLFYLPFQLSAAPVFLISCWINLIFPLYLVTNRKLLSSQNSIGPSLQLQQQQQKKSSSSSGSDCYVCRDCQTLIENIIYNPVHTVTHCDRGPSIHVSLPWEIVWIHSSVTTISSFPLKNIKISL